MERRSQGKGTINIFSDNLLYPPFVFNLEGFELGELNAIAYIDGQRVAEDIVRTAGNPAGLKLSADLSKRAISKTKRM